MRSIFRNRGITFKLIFFILTSCIIIFVGIFSYNYEISREIIIEKIEESARNLTLGTVSKIEAVLRPAEKAPAQIAHLLERLSHDRQRLESMIRLTVEQNPEIYGSTVAFEPHAFDENSLYFAPYFHRVEDEIKYVDLGTDEYNYPGKDWYSLPKKLGRPVWIEPYYDEGGGDILMTTYSVPFYADKNGKRTFAGIVTADVSLSWLQKMIASIKIEKTGYAFLVSKSGKLITHPDKALAMKGTVSDAAGAQDNTELRKIAQHMTEGKFGFCSVENTLTGKMNWITYAPVPSTQWSLAILFPQDEVMSDITNLNRAVFILGFLGIIFLFAVIVLISGSITKPLRVLATKTRAIGSGNLDFDLPPAKTKDEVGSLTNALIYMKNALKKYIRELTETTAAKEKIESELKIARDIQMGILPKTFPPFPDRPEFDIYALLKPAKEVGGDLYDFYFVDDERLCFVIGDVSGKGVPAALFMAVTKTLIKTVAKVIKEPALTLSQVNKELVRDNTSWMFVTVFYGILNTRTGEVCYSSAGHNPPLLIKKGKEPEFIKCDTGIVLGAFEDACYKEHKLVLAPGDTFYLYTDGVTEAMNKENALFSEERLKNDLSGSMAVPIKELAEGTVEEVEAFSRGVPQSDDITILVLRYFGRDKAKEGDKTERITIKSDLTEFRRLTDAITDFGRTSDLSGDSINDINLAVEEVVNNIIDYGYDDGKEHDIDVRIELKGREIILEISDEGKAFDPSKMPDPDMNKPLEERPEGGLGIFLAHNLMDKIEYRREHNRNILVMTKSV